MNPSSGSLDALLITIVLATLAIGLPIVMVLAIRFLWDRSISLGRSKELEKLIWQLHRIASAMEHRMNLSFPAVQPGTEEARDLVFLQPLPGQVAVQPGNFSRPAPAGNASADQQSAQPGLQQAGSQPATATPGAQQPAGDGQRHGINSMFGL